MVCRIEGCSRPSTDTLQFFAWEGVAELRLCSRHHKKGKRAAERLTTGLLIAHDNDTVTELNEQARSHLAASTRLHGPTLEAGDRVFQTGDRILCRTNMSRLAVLNGDLGTVDTVNPDKDSLTVRLDRDPETRDLPSWDLDDGHVDYGYALTGHKAQGVTADRTFTVLTRATDREWAYVAMSRGRQANTLYLANPKPCDERCNHLTHPEPTDALHALTASLARRTTQSAVIDHFAGTVPPSSAVAERVTWIVAPEPSEWDKPVRSSPDSELVVGR